MWKILTIILLTCSAVLAQDGVVMQLNDDEVVRARQSYEEKVAAEADWIIVSRELADKYNVSLDDWQFSLDFHYMIPKVKNTPVLPPCMNIPNYYYYYPNLTSPTPQLIFTNTSHLNHFRNYS